MEDNGILYCYSASKWLTRRMCDIGEAAAWNDANSFASKWETQYGDTVLSLLLNGTAP